MTAFTFRIYHRILGPISFSIEDDYLEKEDAIAAFKEYLVVEYDVDVDNDSEDRLLAGPIKRVY